mmetsp:Transcript_25840/g.89984  ORF Transcript_25840/g.89984 Transcript_25840/m.89984 type:complete len:221 (+) Transcript_25840:909-1571(+)
MSVMVICSRITFSSSIATSARGRSSSRRKRASAAASSSRRAFSAASTRSRHSAWLAAKRSFTSARLEPSSSLHVSSEASDAFRYSTSLLSLLTRASLVARSVASAAEWLSLSLVPAALAPVASSRLFCRSRTSARSFFASSSSRSARSRAARSFLAATVTSRIIRAMSASISWILSSRAASRALEPAVCAAARRSASATRRRVSSSALDLAAAHTFSASS